MKIALVMVILTVAVAAPPEEEFHPYTCSEKCRKEYDMHKMHYFCYKGEWVVGTDAKPSRCFFDCEKKHREVLGKKFEEVECDHFTGCYNNCTEEEKQYEDSRVKKWCAREGKKEVKGHSICFVKCQGRHNWHFEKEPEVVLC